MAYLMPAARTRMAIITVTDNASVSESIPDVVSQF